MRIANKEIMKRFGNIRKSIEDMESAIDGKIYKCADVYAKNIALYSVEHNKKLQPELIARVSNEIMDIKQKTRTITDREFVGIRSALTSWALEAMPPAASASLEILAKYNIKPSLRELEIIEEAGCGNYLVSKLTNVFRLNSGYRENSFLTVDQLERSIDSAQVTINSCISGYRGKMYNHSYVSSELGLEIVENEADQWYGPIAETILTEENPFTIAENLLGEHTQSEYELLPSMRKKIADLLDGKSESERVKVVQECIESDDTEMMDSFKLFDKGLYNQALQSITEYRREALKAAILAKAEASAQAEAARSKLDDIASIGAESA